MTSKPLGRFEVRLFVFSESSFTSVFLLWYCLTVMSRDNAFQEDEAGLLDEFEFESFERRHRRDGSLINYFVFFASGNLGSFSATAVQCVVTMLF